MQIHNRELDREVLRQTMDLVPLFLSTSSSGLRPYSILCSRDDSVIDKIRSDYQLPYNAKLYLLPANQLWGGELELSKCFLVDNHDGSSRLLSRVKGHALFAISDDSHLENLTGRKCTQHHKFLSEVKWKDSVKDIRQRTLHRIQEGAELSLGDGSKTASKPESRAMTNCDQTEVPDKNSCAPEVSQNTELSFELSQNGVIDLTNDDFSHARGKGRVIRGLTTAQELQLASSSVYTLKKGRPGKQTKLRQTPSLESVSESDSETTTPDKRTLPGLSQLLLNRSSENCTRFSQKNTAQSFFRGTTAKSQDISVAHTQVFKVPTSPLKKQSQGMQASVSPVKASTETVTPEFCSVGEPACSKVSTVGDDSRIDEGIVMESEEGDSEEGDDVIVVRVEGEMGVRDEQIISFLRAELRRSPSASSWSISKAVRKLRKVFGEAVVEQKKSLVKEKLQELQSEITSWHQHTPPQSPTVSCCGMTLSQQDLDTLQPGQWLNDQVINCYMRLLMESVGTRLRIHIVSTFFYPKLVSARYRGVERWLKNVDLKKLQLLLIPVHLGNHWCLAAVNFKTKKIEYFDSLGGRNRTCLRLVQVFVLQWAVKQGCTAYVKSRWRKCCAKGIPLQYNGSDCGVFACQFARWRCGGFGKSHSQIPFHQKHIPRIRISMLQELKTCRLTDYNFL